MSYQYIAHRSVLLLFREIEITAAEYNIIFSNVIIMEGRLMVMKEMALVLPSS